MKSSALLTIKELLKRPLFQEAKIVAGEKGIDKEIGWTHVLDISTAKQFVNKKDLILTTGIGFHHNTKNSLSYLKEIIDQGASGL